MHKHSHKVLSVVQGKNTNSYMEVFKFYFNSWIWMWKTINTRKGREGVGIDQFWLDPCLTSQNPYLMRVCSVANHRPHLVTCCLCIYPTKHFKWVIIKMNWHILLNFTFHLQQKCSGMFVYYEYLKTLHFKILSHQNFPSPKSWKC